MIKNRLPFVAGQFYQSNPVELKIELEGLFERAVPCKMKNVIAVITPHAGYMFSGTVAASAFNQIDPEKKYKNIFILASSHRFHFNGASIYNIGNYLTPLGEIKVDLELADKLIHAHNCFKFDSNSHISEHSLEVQLPFLQYVLKNEILLVPIIIGTDSENTCKEIASALMPYFNDETLFIVSTDFSHYPSYHDAVQLDKLTAETILTNSSDSLLIALKSPKLKMIPDLATSLCGWTSVLTLLYITEKNKTITYTLIDYKNSGDSLFGDKERVVGYNAIAVCK